MLRSPLPAISIRTLFAVQQFTPPPQSHGYSFGANLCTSASSGTHILASLLHSPALVPVVAPLAAAPKTKNRHVCFSSDGTLLAISDDKPTIRIYDVQSQSLLSTTILKDPGWGTTALVSFDCEGKKLLAHIRGHGSAVVISAFDVSCEEIKVLTIPKRANDRDIDLICHSSSQQVLIVSSNDGEKHFYSTANPELKYIGSVHAEDRSAVMVVSPDGTLLAVSTESGCVEIFDVRTRTVVRQGSDVYSKERGDTEPAALAFSHDSKFLMIAASYGNTKVLCLSDKSDKHFSVFDDASPAFFSQDDSETFGIYSRSPTSITFWKHEQGTPSISRILEVSSSSGSTGQENHLVDFCLSPDGKKMACITQSGPIPFFLSDYPFTSIIQSPPIAAAAAASVADSAVPPPSDSISIPCPNDVTQVRLYHQNAFVSSALIFVQQSNGQIGVSRLQYFQFPMFGQTKMQNTPWHWIHPSIKEPMIYQSNLSQLIMILDNLDPLKENSLLVEPVYFGPDAPMSVEAFELGKVFARSQSVPSVPQVVPIAAAVAVAVRKVDQSVQMDDVHSEEQEEKKEELENLKRKFKRKLSELEEQEQSLQAYVAKQENGMDAALMELMSADFSKEKERSSEDVVQRLKTTIQQHISSSLDELKQVPSKRKRLSVSSSLASSSSSMEMNAEKSEEEVLFEALKENMISWSSLSIIKQIGNGGFGSVYLCEMREDSDEQLSIDEIRKPVLVALKVPSIGLNIAGNVMESKQQKQMSQMEKERKVSPQEKAILQALQTEISTYRRIDHPNVIRYLGCTVSPSYPFSNCLVQQYCAAGDLSSFMKSNKIQDRGLDSEKFAFQVALQVASGLAALHDLGVIHRDLKPHNILLCVIPSSSFDVPIVKISDLGSASLHHLNEELSRVTGRHAVHDASGTGLQPTAANAFTSRYTAPELLQRRMKESWKDSYAQDVWAFGLLLFQLTTGCIPFQDDDEMTVISSIVSGEEPGEWPSSASSSSSDSPPLKTIANLCLTAAPKERITHFKELGSIRADGRDIFGSIEKHMRALKPDWAKEVLANILRFQRMEIRDPFLTNQSE